MANPSRRYILHADLDAFYASVEQRDNPSLKGRPVVVGGPPETRGVVAAASYEARKYGVHSAMPMRTAFRLCPELVRVSPRFAKYGEVSGQVMGIFRAVTPLVQPLSLDEAYLDISEQVAMGAERDVARDIKAAVRRDTELVVTIGGGTSKTVAKIASQLAKPDGLLLVEAGAERDFLAPLDVDFLWGVGPKTAGLLKHHGVNTIGDVAGCDKGWLLQTLGKRGPELRQRALGADQERVTPFQETKSVSAEVTMAIDVGEEPLMVEHVERLAHRVASRLLSGGLTGRTVSVKLRLADFTTFTRQTTLTTPTDDEEIILHAALELMQEELRPSRKFRLVGLGVSNFMADFQLALLPMS